MVLSHGTGVRIPVAVPSFARVTPERASDGKPRELTSRTRRMSTIARGNSARATVDLHPLASSFGWQARGNRSFHSIPATYCSAETLRKLVGILLAWATACPNGSYTYSRTTRVRRGIHWHHLRRRPTNRRTQCRKLRSHSQVPTVVRGSRDRVPR